MSELKEYISHKRVHARPMLRGDYNEYRGWDLPENENPMDEGYLVVYSKGTEDHYESWSPQKQFEDGYSILSPGNFLDRLVLEEAALAIKVEALSKFVTTTGFRELPKESQDLLKAQLQTMLDYDAILKERIRLAKLAA